MSKRPSPTRRSSKPAAQRRGNQSVRGWVAALRDAREDAGLSLQQAAEQVGISRAFWHQVEKGYKMPSPALAVLMVTAMNLSGRVQDAAASDALRRSFRSPGCCGHEAAILAAIASAGFGVEVQPRGGAGSRVSGPDTVVTLPDGVRVALRMVTKTCKQKLPPHSGG